MAKLSEEKIALIIETYRQVGTYSGTAKICGTTAQTVKKYVNLRNEVNETIEPSIEPMEKIESIVAQVPNAIAIDMVIQDNLLQLTKEEEELMSQFFQKYKTYKRS